LFAKQVSKEERVWAFRFSLLVLLITTVPYWIGFASAGSDWRFAGFIFGIEDGNSYIAKMLSGAAGSWLFRTPYTAEPQGGFLAFLPYILLGKLTSAPGQHEQLLVLFQLFRMVGIFMFIFATYEFVALFIDQQGWRKAAVVLVALGGGIGWLFMLFFGKGDRLPLEFYSPETFGFLSLYGLPHLAVARGLLVWGLVCYLLPSSTSMRINNALTGGIHWLLLGFFQPLTVVIGWAVLAAHLAALGVSRWLRNRKTGLREWDDWTRYFRKAVVMGLISLPLVLYTMVSFWVDPFLRGWGAQNLILSPPPQDYLLAYGLLLPIAFLAVKPLLDRYPLKGPMLVGWLVMLPILAYAPYNLQRRLPEGGWAVIVILAVFYLKARVKAGRQVMAGLLIVMLVPALILIAGGVMSATRVSEPAFQPAEQVDAFEHLKEYAAPWEVVLGAYSTSNVLPAWAPLNVAIGHGPESVGLAYLQPRVERFYHRETPDADREWLLRELKARFVFWGPDERLLAGTDPAGWNPDEAEYLQLIYSQGQYQIYEVREDRIVAP
jgi:hypothetical protein